MGDNNKSAQILSIGAATGVALLALNRRASAEPATIVGLDEAAMQLLMAIANKLNEITEGVELQVQGYPSNTNGFQTFVVPCPAALAPYQFPAFDIPDGFQLVITSSPTNGGMILIGQNAAECVNANQAYALLPGGSVTLAITNSNLVWASAAVALDTVQCIVETRRG